jgi:SAM-dependent methyltransferase
VVDANGVEVLDRLIPRDRRRLETRFGNVAVTVRLKKSGAAGSRTPIEGAQGMCAIGRATCLAQPLVPLGDNVAVDELYKGQKRYYHLRAREYDATSWEVAAERRPAELAALIGVLGSFPAVRTLDVACGTGFLTQFLPGTVTLLDASEDMLTLAAERVPGAELVQANALPLPFPDSSFERVFASLFYGHLRPSERRLFLTEARRLAPELVLVEQTRGPRHWEGLQERALQDGSTHMVYTTYFSPDSLLAGLGGGDLLHAGGHNLVVRRRRDA